MEDTGQKSLQCDFCSSTIIFKLYLHCFSHTVDQFTCYGLTIQSPVLYNKKYQLQEMAKSLRSKVKRRWRALRKGHIDNVLVKPALLETQKKLEASVVGLEYREEEKKNAFLHPQDSNAEFPQVHIQKNIDLRSNAIPGSGLQYVGASRKFRQKKTEGKVEEQQRSQNNDGQMEEEKTFGRALIKKDKKKKSKLRKTIVF